MVSNDTILGSISQTYIIWENVFSKSCETAEKHVYSFRNKIAKRFLTSWLLFLDTLWVLGSYWEEHHPLVTRWVRSWRLEATVTSPNPPTTGQLPPLGEPLLAAAPLLGNGLHSYFINKGSKNINKDKREIHWFHMRYSILITKLDSKWCNRTKIIDNGPSFGEKDAHQTCRNYFRSSSWI